jgi:hypothetical protein
VEAYVVANMKKRAWSRLLLEAKLHRTQECPGQHGKRHEKRDLPATWRPPERAYRTVHFVLPCQALGVPDANASPERHAVSSFSMAYAHRPTISRGLRMVRMSTKNKPPPPVLHVEAVIPMFDASNSPRAAANDIETRREKTRLAGSDDVQSVLPQEHGQYARTVVTTLDSSQHIHVASESGPLARIGSNGLQSEPSLLASHFLHCWANELWATEMLPNPHRSSCALNLQHHGVLVLQSVKLHRTAMQRRSTPASRNGSRYSSSTGWPKRDTLSFLREPTSPDVFPVFSTFISGREKWDMWPNRHGTQMLIRQPGRMPREVSRTGPVGCPP